MLSYGIIRKHFFCKNLQQSEWQQNLEKNNEILGHGT